MNAFNRLSHWYYTPLAEWCRRTKVNSQYNREPNYGIITGTPQPYYVCQLKDAAGETWQLKEVHFNLFGRIALWLIGFRRETK
jgi:hypothetical protein